jgi:hypothetical protein
VSIFLALPALHAALHWARTSGVQFAERLSVDHDRWSAAMAHWPPLVAVLSLVLLVVIALSSSAKSFRGA